MECVRKLRKALTRMTRWPEMVTFEELNRPLPTGREIYNLLFRDVLADSFEPAIAALDLDLSPHDDKELVALFALPEDRFALREIAGRCRFPLRFDPGFPLRTDPA